MNMHLNQSDLGFDTEDFRVGGTTVDGMSEERAEQIDAANSLPGFNEADFAIRSVSGVTKTNGASNSLEKPVMQMSHPSQVIHSVVADLDLVDPKWLGVGE